MEVIKNIIDSDGEIKGDCYFTLYEKYISFYVDEESTLEYAKICIEYLNSLNDEVIISFCEASARYCNDFLNMTGQELKTFNNPKDILSLIQPKNLMIPEQAKGNTPIIHMELDGDWEMEHGIELIIKDNEIQYVGGFNGQWPWADFTNKESWNYA